MAKGFYLGSRLRRYAYCNQFGARSEEVQVAVTDLMEEVDRVIGSHIKGTLVSDVYHSHHPLEEPEDHSARKSRFPLSV
jgi:hypothetical protein